MNIAKYIRGLRSATRKRKILRHINPRGRGLEIGPSYSPVAAKKDGYKAEVIDHVCREELCAKYENHGVNTKNIEDVDFVWQGQSYAELTGKSKYYDWIIASHMVEHTPDLIGFLNECDTILKDDGVVSLAVPDKRYCFDHYRPITGLSRVIDSHFSLNHVHTPGSVAEFFLNAVSKGEESAWSSLAPGGHKVIHSLNDVRDRMRQSVEGEDYVDVHAWCFVPHSFRLMIHDLHSLGLIPFREVGFFPTEGCEFYVALGREGEGSGKSRLEMLEIIGSEIADRHSVGEIALAHIKNTLKRLCVS